MILQPGPKPPASIAETTGESDSLNVAVKAGWVQIQPSWAPSMAPWLTTESSYLIRRDIGEFAAGMRKCSVSSAGVSKSHNKIFDPTRTPQDRNTVRIERGGSPSSRHGSPSSSAEGGSHASSENLNFFGLFILSVSSAPQGWIGQTDAGDLSGLQGIAAPDRTCLRLEHYGNTLHMTSLHSCTASYPWSAGACHLEGSSTAYCTH